MVNANGVDEVEYEDIPLAVQIAERDDWTCRECGYEAQEDDIMESAYTGAEWENGPGDPENPDDYVLLCKDCKDEMESEVAESIRQTQIELNERGVTGGEKSEGQLRAVVGLFLPLSFAVVLPFGMIYRLITTYPPSSATTLELGQYIIAHLAGAPTGFVYIYMILVVGSWVEPHNGWFTRIRKFAGGKLISAYNYLAS